MAGAHGCARPRANPGCRGGVPPRRPRDEEAGGTCARRPRTAAAGRVCRGAPALRRVDEHPGGVGPGRSAISSPPGSSVTREWCTSTPALRRTFRRSSSGSATRQRGALGRHGRLRDVVDLILDGSRGGREAPVGTSSRVSVNAACCRAGSGGRGSTFRRPGAGSPVRCVELVGGNEVGTGGVERGGALPLRPLSAGEVELPLPLSDIVGDRVAGDVRESLLG